MKIKYDKENDKLLLTFEDKYNFKGLVTNNDLSVFFDEEKNIVAIEINNPLKLMEENEYKHKKIEWRKR